MAKNQPNAAEDLQTEILLKEADDALRQEKLEVMWKEWGQTIIGVALMIIFGTMLGVGWKNWRHNVYEARTQALLIAENRGIAGLVMAADGDLAGAHRGVAYLLAAGNMLGSIEGDVVPAEIRPVIVDSAAVAADAGLPREWDMLAEWTRLRTQADDATEAAKKMIIAEEMMAIAARRKNPYAPMMMVEAAAIYGENGYPQKALESLDRAAKHDFSRNTPAVMDEIQKLMHLYALDKVGE